MPKGMVENVIGGATAGTKLREMIRQLEIDVVNLKGKHEKILDILKLRDEIQIELQRLLDQNLNLKSEQTRIETCDLIMVRQVQLVEGDAGCFQILGIGILLCDGDDRCVAFFR